MAMIGAELATEMVQKHIDSPLPVIEVRPLTGGMVNTMVESVAVVDLEGPPSRARTDAILEEIRRQESLAPRSQGPHRRG